MIPLVIALIALVAGGSTIAASDSSRPGDLLFPIDRTVESVRLTFAGQEGKAKLQVEFAEERLDEVESLIKEESEDDDTATSTEEVSDDAKENLSHALDILTGHLAEIRGVASTTPGVAQAISVIEERLLKDADALPEELRVRVKGEDGKVELRTANEKIKVKIDDGEIEVEIESEDADEDGDDRSQNSGKRLNSATSSPSSNDDEEDTDSDDVGQKEDEDSGGDHDSTEPNEEDEDDSDSGSRSGSNSGSSN